MELWRELSVGEIYISGEFNGCSRNAIIGRVFRLRKRWGTEMVPVKQIAGGTPAPKKKRRRKPSYNTGDRQIVIAEPTPIRKPPAPPCARRLPLLELNKNDCRFIVTGDEVPRHLYCAVDASAFVGDDGSNCYCAFHQRVMRASGGR